MNQKSSITDSTTKQMRKLKLKKVRTLVASNKIEDAIKQMLTIASELNNDLYTDVITLSARYKNWDSQVIRGNVNDGERNQIITALLSTVDDSEDEINTLIRDAEDAEKKGNYREAIANVERVLVTVEDEILRDYKVDLTESILQIHPVSTPQENKFSFVWVFITSAILTSIIPLIIYYQKNAADFSIAYMVNLVLQISLLTCMVLYSIKPRVDVDQFIQDASDFIQGKFGNRVDDLKWFSERANEGIKQFGKWWRYLGISFLGLYVLYYVQACVKGSGRQFLPQDFEEYVDVVINGSEAFFLFVLYRIITDDTIKPSPQKNKAFEQNLNIQAEFGVLTIALFLYVLGNLIYSPSDNYGVFKLISRTISGAVVAVGLCLVIGRLDSKFIEPKKWELWILYLYAAIQLLFTLFDPTLFEAATGERFGKEEKEVISEYFGTVKMWVLYYILALKGFFIYFVVKIHRKNELFYYLLIGSKLNDEIKEGKRKNNKAAMTKNESVAHTS